MKLKRALRNTLRQIEVLLIFHRVCAYCVYVWVCNRDAFYRGCYSIRSSCASNTVHFGLVLRLLETIASGAGD